MTSFQNISPLQSEQLAHAHIIKSDEEALEIAHNLAEQFKINSVQRDAERILPSKKSRLIASPTLGDYCT